jgi:hypothetical protein
MIGTLVVQLPCAQGHTGGSLTVRHRGKSHTHEFAQVSCKWALPGTAFGLRPRPRLALS